MAIGHATVTIEAGGSWKAVRDEMRAEVEAMKGLLAMSAQIKFNGPRFRVERIVNEATPTLAKELWRVTFSSLSRDDVSGHFTIACADEADAKRYRVGDEFHLSLSPVKAMPEFFAPKLGEPFRVETTTGTPSSIGEVLDSVCKAYGSAPPLEQVDRALRFACGELVNQRPDKWPGVEGARREILSRASRRYHLKDRPFGMTDVMDGSKHVASFTGQHNQAREYCQLLNDRHWRQFGEWSPLRAEAA